MLGTPQDRLWDQLVRQVQGLPEDSMVEIIDYFSRQESAEVFSGEHRQVRRVIKWPVHRPRRAS